MGARRRHGRVSDTQPGVLVTTSHCPTCICGRRAPVQADPYHLPDPRRGPGTITWEEHLRAWNGYAARYPQQSAERVAERGGFSYGELVMFLGREPATWEPRNPVCS